MSSSCRLIAASSDGEIESPLQLLNSILHGFNMEGPWWLVFEAFIGEVGVLVLLQLMSSLDSVFAWAGELDSQQFSPCFRPQQDVRAVRDVSDVHWEPVVTVFVVSKIEADDPVMGGAQSFSQSGGCL